MVAVTNLNSLVANWLTWTKLYIIRRSGGTVKQSRDREWCEYPIGTKAHAFNGGHWVRVTLGWKWCTGATFPTPGCDAIGACIELPDIKSNDTSAKES
jgi:hypothetical protein